MTYFAGFVPFVKPAFSGGLNGGAAAQVVARRGMTTRQAARLVDMLLATPAAEWSRVLDEASQAAPVPAPKGGAPRRTPGEQLVADAWAMKRIATRLHPRLAHELRHLL